MTNKFNDFVSEIKTRGLAKQNSFVVEITPPPFLMGDADIGVIPLFCESVTFPEKALLTSSIKDDGLTREVVYDKAFGQVVMTFICDQQMVIKSFFDDWVSIPIQHDGGFFAYPKTYKSEKIGITQVDAQRKEVYSNYLINAYPKVVNDIMASAQARDFHRFQVVFTYDKWIKRKHDSILAPLQPGQKRSLDIARILNYAGGVSKEGLQSSILRAGTDELMKIFSGTSTIEKSTSTIGKNFGISGI